MAKMLQLTVLANENNMEMGEIEKMLTYLSNMHQICAIPTSLPLPVFLVSSKLSL
jgi:hypothetical protein